MKNTQRYYLYKDGSLLGPLNEDQLNALKVSKKINQYSWIIDEAKQSWSPITAAPSENPFQMTEKAIGKSELTGAFVFMKQPFLGVIQGIHSFGVELLVKQTALKSLSLIPESIIRLNLADETNSKEFHTQVKYQGSERHPEGILLRFGWMSALAQL